MDQTSEEYADRDPARVARDLRDISDVLHHLRDHGDLDDGSDEREQHTAEHLAADRHGDAPLPQRTSHSTSAMITNGSISGTPIG